MKRVIVCFLIVGFGLLLKGCNTTEPPVEKAALLLKLEDASCSEAWITLTTTNLPLPATITLKQNNAVRKTLNLTTADTLLYIDSLLPNTSYVFYTAIQSYNQTSNELSVTTMDTTSHDFTWQTFEFGEIIYQNHLYDVAIINDTLAYAVGEIHRNDTMYNAAKWDGVEWKLLRILFYTICGQQDQNAYPASSILAFSENYIWVGMQGSQVARLNDTTQIGTYCIPISVRKLWGTDSQNIYAVGVNGQIAHYNGSQWTLIESGTDFLLYDIAVNDLGQIFICGGNPSFAQGIILKSIDGSIFETFAEGANIPESELFNPNLYGSFSSIWFDQNNTLYSGGNILFQYKFNKWYYVKSLPENFIGGNPGAFYRGYITKVRGNASNDMWIVGDRNTLRHFNGLSWQQIGMPYDPQIDIVWRGIDRNNNNIVVVGTHERSAIIMMIKR